MARLHNQPFPNSIEFLTLKSWNLNRVDNNTIFLYYSQLDRESRNVDSNPGSPIKLGMTNNTIYIFKSVSNSSFVGEILRKLRYKLLFNFIRKFSLLVKQFLQDCAGRFEDITKKHFIFMKCFFIYSFNQFSKAVNECSRPKKFSNISTASLTPPCFKAKSRKRLAGAESIILFLSNWVIAS